MDVQAEVDREREKVQRINAVARRVSMPLFCDLIGWEGDVPDDPIALTDNPGVLFESSRRVVVFQQICGELRYYAGGWCPDQKRIYLEEERILAEGSELGVFETVQDAVEFAEEYLVDERDFQAIHVPRRVRYRHTPRNGANSVKT